MPSSPRCSLYLITPPLTGGANTLSFAKLFADTLAATPTASALVRFAPNSGGDAKAIIALLVKAAVAADCALILENDARLAARLGADGVHVAGAGEALEEALDSLKPERIVGAGALRMRDEAMTAGEKGADYVMFGEPRGARHGAGTAGRAGRLVGGNLRDALRRICRVDRGGRQARPSWGRLRRP